MSAKPNRTYVVCATKKERWILKKVLNKKYYHQHGLPKNVGILKREVLSNVDDEIIKNYDIILDFFKKNKVN